MATNQTLIKQFFNTYMGRDASDLKPDEYQTVLDEANARYLISDDLRSSLSAILPQLSHETAYSLLQISIGYGFNDIQEQTLLSCIQQGYDINKSASLIFAGLNEQEIKDFNMFYDISENSKLSDSSFNEYMIQYMKHNTSLESTLQRITEDVPSSALSQAYKLYNDSEFLPRIPSPQELIQCAQDILALDTNTNTEHTRKTIDNIKSITSDINTWASLTNIHTDFNWDPELQQTISNSTDKLFTHDDIGLAPILPFIHSIEPDLNAAMSIIAQIKQYALAQRKVIFTCQKCIEFLSENNDDDLHKQFLRQVLYHYDGKNFESILNTYRELYKQDKDIAKCLCIDNYEYTFEQQHSNVLRPSHDYVERLTNEQHFNRDVQKLQILKSLGIDSRVWSDLISQEDINHFSPAEFAIYVALTQPSDNFQTPFSKAEIHAIKDAITSMKPIEFEVPNVTDTFKFNNVLIGDHMTQRTLISGGLLRGVVRQHHLVCLDAVRLALWYRSIVNDIQAYISDPQTNNVRNSNMIATAGILYQLAEMTGHTRKETQQEFKNLIETNTLSPDMLYSILNARAASCEIIEDLVQTIGSYYNQNNPKLADRLTMDSIDVDDAINKFKIASWHFLTHQKEYSKDDADAISSRISNLYDQIDRLLHAEKGWSRTYEVIPGFQNKEHEITQLLCSVDKLYLQAAGIIHENLDFASHKQDTLLKTLTRFYQAREKRIDSEKPWRVHVPENLATLAYENSAAFKQAKDFFETHADQHTTDSHQALPDDEHKLLENVRKLLEDEHILPGDEHRDKAKALTDNLPAETKEAVTANINNITAQTGADKDVVTPMQRTLADELISSDLERIAQNLPEQHLVKDELLTIASLYKQAEQLVDEAVQNGYQTAVSELKKIVEDFNKNPELTQRLNMVVNNTDLSGAEMYFKAYALVLQENIEKARENYHADVNIDNKIATDKLATQVDLGLAFDLQKSVAQRYDQEFGTDESISKPANTEPDNTDSLTPTEQIYNQWIEQVDQVMEHYNQVLAEYTNPLTMFDCSPNEYRNAVDQCVQEFEQTRTWLKEQPGLDQTEFGQLYQQADMNTKNFLNIMKGETIRLHSIEQPNHSHDDSLC